MPELVSMQNQFTGLPMRELIGGPLDAACSAQVRMAQATADFIQNVGFENGKTRVAKFGFDRNKVTGKDELGHDIIESENIKLEVPLISIVTVPTLQIDEVDITFDMEVKSSTSEAESSSASAAMSGSAKVGWGPFSASISISGSVASHKECTRTSDNSAKYHVAVHAKSMGTPEGLSRVLDIIASCVAPSEATSPQARKDAMLNDKLGPEKNKIKGIQRDIDSLTRQIDEKKHLLEIEKSKPKEIPGMNEVDDDKKYISDLKSNDKYIAAKKI